MQKCAKCGLDFSDTTASMCPMCGTRIGPAAIGKWIGALVQLTLSTAFILIFHFPRIMIVIFGTFIVVATALSGQMKPKSVPASGTVERPVAHATLFRILSLGVAILSLAFFIILLFGFVIFLNSYSRWQRYEGQSYHRADFEVTRVYFQRGSKGGVDAYASGTVDGQREWMSLVPYLDGQPHDEAELDERVPIGTSIPVYFFPGMKGRFRVQVLSEIPPAEASHRDAMNALNYGLGGLALTGGIIFVLVRLRRLCFEKPNSDLVSPSTGPPEVTASL